MAHKSPEKDFLGGFNFPSPVVRRRPQYSKTLAHTPSSVYSVITGLDDIELPCAAVSSDFLKNRDFSLELSDIPMASPLHAMYQYIVPAISFNIAARL